MNRGITKENLLLITPPALRYDKSIMALAEADAEVLAARLAEIDRVRVISNIDGLEEAVLNILARDFKVDWYNPDYSLEEKRQTLKDSWRVHKTLGTKAAVETAISAIYPATKVQEWFEYGGEPYHFKLCIDISKEGGDKTRAIQVLKLLNFYKNLRSHLDVIEYIANAPLLERPVYAAPCLVGLLSSTALPKVDPALERTVVTFVPWVWGCTSIQALPSIEPHFDGERTVRFAPLLSGSFSITRLPVLLRPVDVRVAAHTGGGLSVTELPEV